MNCLQTSWAVGNGRLVSWRRERDYFASRRAWGRVGALLEASPVNRYHTSTLVARQKRGTRWCGRGVRVSYLIHLSRLTPISSAVSWRDQPSDSLICRTLPTKLLRNSVGVIPRRSVTDCPRPVAGQVVLALLDKLSIITSMKSYSEVIGLWPSLAELASDTGKTEEAVRKWKERKKIPSSNWPEVAEAAAKRNFPVDLQLLASLRKQKQRRTMRA
jgi:hypothetical protein